MNNETDLMTIAQAVGELTRTVKQMSSVIDLLFGYIARHADKDELAKVADSIKREA